MKSDTGDVSHFSHYPLQINLGKTALRRQLAAAKCLWAGEMFLLKQTCSSLTYFSGSRQEGGRVGAHVKISRRDRGLAACEQRAHHPRWQT